MCLSFTRMLMKPYVICLMACSVDGRTLPSRWRPKGAAGDVFERVHDQLAGDAWLIGRVTGQEFAKGKSYPASAKEVFPRAPWFARRYQARSSGANDDDVFWLPPGHAGFSGLCWSLLTGRLG